ncbi:hypothetical protein [Reichenbachiella agariperforans]|uniref:hypothetical protein n=1 Tax=Reichenbachiella agariperforans TaxID=156994 RepID=UPI001C092D33|nr:hypothetical protein [Reichenbachiella agariperforans]MBU2916335.1 hypothetical protein [Reichenbachiella agariperforans]
MQILKLNQTIQYSTNLDASEVSERINQLLDKTKQTAPNWLRGMADTNKFIIENRNGAYHLTPIISAVITARKVKISIQPSLNFKAAIIITIIVNLALIISLAFNLRDNWMYILPLPIIHFLIFNFEGIKNYSSLIGILEQALELTKEEDNRVDG